MELFESSLVQHPEFFPDGLHLNVAGAREIAALVGKALLEDLRETGEEEQKEQTSRAEEQLVEEERQIVLRELSKMRQQQQQPRSWKMWMPFQQ